MRQKRVGGCVQGPRGIILRQKRWPSEGVRTRKKVKEGGFANQPPCDKKKGPQNRPPRQFGKRNPAGGRSLGEWKELNLTPGRPRGVSGRHYNALEPRKGGA